MPEDSKTPSKYRRRRFCPSHTKRLVRGSLRGSKWEKMWEEGISKVLRIGEVSLASSVPSQAHMPPRRAKDTRGPP